jgi:hypothetical protein
MKTRILPLLLALFSINAGAQTKFSSIVFGNPTHTYLNLDGSVSMGSSIKWPGDITLSDHNGSMSLLDSTSTQFTFDASTAGDQLGNVYAATFNGAFSGSGNSLNNIPWTALTIGLNPNQLGEAGNQLYIVSGPNITNINWYGPAASSMAQGGGSGQPVTFTTSPTVGGTFTSGSIIAGNFDSVPSGIIHDLTSAYAGTASFGYSTNTNSITFLGTTATKGIVFAGYNSGSSATMDQKANGTLEILGSPASGNGINLNGQGGGGVNVIDFINGNTIFSNNATANSGLYTEIGQSGVTNVGGTASFAALSSTGGHTFSGPSPSIDISLPVIPTNGFYTTIGTLWTNNVAGGKGATGQRGFFTIPFSFSSGSGTGWGANIYITNYTGVVGAPGTFTNVQAWGMGEAGLTALTQSGSNVFSGWVYSNSILEVIQTVGTITILTATNNQSQISWQ